MIHPFSFDDYLYVQDQDNFPQKYLKDIFYCQIKRKLFFFFVASSVLFKKYSEILFKNNIPNSILFFLKEEICIMKQCLLPMYVSLFVEYSMD